MVNDNPLTWALAWVILTGFAVALTFHVPHWIAATITTIRRITWTLLARR